jgi:Outer membrane protein beta-barrel domain
MSPAVARLAGTALALGLAVPTAAHAGTYVGVGVGTAASTDGGFTRFGTDGQHSGRIVLGQRFGKISIEAAVNDIGLAYRGVDSHATSLGAVGGLHLPLVSHLEGYVRFGLERTWLRGDSTVPAAQGDGWTGGLGLEYRIDAVLANGSIWADYTRHATKLTANSFEADGTANAWTVGLSVGI